jgi:hypothetical protein
LSEFFLLRLLLRQQRLVLRHRQLLVDHRLVLDTLSPTTEAQRRQRLLSVVALRRTGDDQAGLGVAAQCVTAIMKERGDEMDKGDRIETDSDMNLKANMPESAMDDWRT